MKVPYHVVLPSYFAYILVYLLGVLRDLFRGSNLENKAPQVNFWFGEPEH